MSFKYRWDFINNIRSWKTVFNYLKNWRGYFKHIVREKNYKCKVKRICCLIEFISRTDGQR